MPYKHILVATDAQLTSLYVVLEGVPTAFTGSRLYASSVMAPKCHAALGSQTMKTVAHTRIPVLVCR